LPSVNALALISGNLSNVTFEVESTLKPKRLEVMTGASTWLIEQSQADINRVVTSNLMENAAARTAYALLYGNGTNQPQGLFGNAKVNTFTFGGTDVVGDMLTLIDTVETANIPDDGTMGFIVSPDVEKTWASTLQKPSTAKLLYQDGQALGYPCFTSSLLATGPYKNFVAFGRMSDVVLGSYPYASVLTNKFSRATQFQILYYLSLMLGIAYKRYEGLYVSTNAAI
jgi:HK97 family phage major capsid protein